MFKLILCSVLIIAVHAADHETFKNCSRVAFCNNFRNSIISNDYWALLDTFKLTNGDATAEVTLTNADNENLILSVTNNDNVFRTIIREINSKRYELVDVLAQEPVTQKFDDYQVNQENVTIEAGENEIVIVNRPFSVLYYQNSILSVVLNGTDLKLNNGESDQSFSFRVDFPQAQRIYGLHEHADNLTLQNTEGTKMDPYRLRNLDVAGYELHSVMSLYGAVPVLYGHGVNSTSGIFLHNAAEQWIDIKSSRNNTKGSRSRFMVESGTLDLFVILGPKPKNILHRYANLTGVAHLPQLWTLGYHQCRWNYDNVSDVETVIAKFDQHDFPLDAIWLDIEYTDGKRYFTWNPENFTDPIAMQQNISSTNRKLVTIIDPHIKVDENYHVYSNAKAQNLFVNYANGTAFEGDCWPGLSSYLDFMNPEASDYYSNLYLYDNFNGSTPVLAGIWNDMNEPSVFDDSIEKTFPGDLVHHGGVVHKDVHNIYGFLQTRATHEGLMRRDDGKKRPFILTRSHFAGSQRYASIWTGDNTADWGYLSVSYAECLNANILGISFCGADVGGFFNDPDEELLQRWYQAGAWLPFFRGHANLGTKRREPYLFSEEVQEVIRNALNTRYKHIEHIYTLFYEHTRFGNPVIRPLFYEYPDDESVIDIDNHLLLGNSILVRPVTEPGVKEVIVYFPGGINVSWYDLRNDIIHPGLGYSSVPVDISYIPVFYKMGSVISIREGETIRSTADIITADRHHFTVFGNENDIAEGTFYEDDYESFEYINGDYSYRQITCAGDECTIKELGTKKSSSSKLKIAQMTFYHYKSDGENKYYEKTVHTTTSDGTLLSEIDFENTVTLSFS